MKKAFLPAVLCATLLAMAGCATESSRVVESPKVSSHGTAYQGQKAPISVGKFDNKSSFQNGVFQDGEDRLGNQSRTILVAHLQQTGRFNVLDRTNMSEAAQEAKISGRAQNLKGATYLISGDVTEFGRKNVGDHQLFGILGRGKK